jgi:hypothetical protein
MLYNNPGFSSSIRSIRSVRHNSRKAMQIASRKRNRIRRVSRALTPLSPAVRATRRAARAARVARRAARTAALIAQRAARAAREARRAAYVRSTLVLQSPAMKRALKPLPRLNSGIVAPIRRRQRPAQMPRRNSSGIISALIEGRKPYHAKGRTCVGKKYPVKRVDVPKLPKKEKKCMVVPLPATTTSNYQRLVDLAAAFNVSVVVDPSLTDLGQWDGSTITIREEHDHVLAHELCHFALDMGLEVDLRMVKSTSDVWNDVAAANDHDEIERICYHVMWDVDYLICLLSTYYIAIKALASDWDSALTTSPTHIVLGMWFDVNEYITFDEVPPLWSDFYQMYVYNTSIDEAVTILSGAEPCSSPWKQVTAIMAKHYPYRPNEVTMTRTMLEYNATENLEKAYDQLCGILAACDWLTPADLAWIEADLTTTITPSDCAPYAWFIQRTGSLAVPALLVYGIDELNAVSRALVAFHNAGATIFPYWFFNQYDNVVIVDQYDHDQTLDAIRSSGMKISYAQPVKGYAGWELVGAEEYDLPAWDGVDNNTLYLSTQKPGTLNYRNCPKCYTPYQLALAHTAHVVGELDNIDKVSFAVAFGGLTRLNNYTLGLKPTGRTTYSYAEFDYEAMEIRTTREFKIRGKAFVEGHGMLDGASAMTLFAIELAGIATYNVGQSVIDGKLVMLTQMEEEEDNYGQVYEERQELRIIRSNTVAILTVVKNNKFPYYRMINHNNMNGVLSCVNWCISNKTPFWIDKNANKRVVIGPALAALWVTMDFNMGAIRTLLDVSKVGKLPTRGWQTLCIAADQGHPLVHGDNFRPHVWAGLIRNTSDGEIRIKGQMEDTLMCDGSLIFNGSGVGYTRTTFPCGIFKTLRGSFNYINMRAGETSVDVKEELCSMLDELLDSNKRIRATKNGTVVLRFRGRNLLTYKGLNQDAIISREVGCRFEVQDVATSATLSIKLTIFYYWNDTNVKVRGIGEKTMLKHDHLLEVEGANPAIVLGAECLKGTAAIFQGYTNWVYRLVSSQGGTAEDAHTYSFVNDVTVYDSPEIIDGVWTGGRVTINLSEEDNQFMNWWRTNRQTYAIRNWVARDTFQYLLAARVGMEGASIEEALSHPKNVDILLVDEDGSVTNNAAAASNGRYIHVQETVRGILCPYVYQVELASVREVCSVDVSPTPQQLSAIYAAYPALGKFVATGAEELEDAVMGCVAMATNNPGAKLVGSEVGLDNSDADVIKATNALTSKLAKALNEDYPVFASSRNMYTPNNDPLLAFVDPGVVKKFEPKPLTNVVGITEGKGFTVLDCIKGTSTNYSIAVGQVYNLSSALTALLIRTRHRRDTTAGVDPAGNALAKKEFNTVAVSNFLGWMTAYENGILASYNVKGTHLLRVLNQGAYGNIDDQPIADKDIVERYLRPAILAVEVDLSMDIVHGLVNPDATPEERATYQAELEAANAKMRLNSENIHTLLYAYRIALAIGQWERKSFTPARGEVSDRSWLLKKLCLNENDIPTIVLAGCIRRLGEGSYARGTDYLTEDSDENGESMWSALSREWDIVSNEIPHLFRRKLYKAMRAHEMLKDVTIDSVTDENGGNSNRTGRATRENGRVIFSAENADNIPFIPLEFGTISSEEATIFVQDLGPEEQARFTSEEISFAELGGAFDVFEYSCPVSYIGSYPNCEACLPNKSHKWYYRVTSDGEVTFNKGVIKEDVFHDVSPLPGWNWRSPMYFWREVASPKRIIQKAARRYPNGVLIGSDEGLKPIEVYFDFNAILSSGAFSASGSTTGFALQVVNLLINISKPFGERRVEFERQLRNTLAGCQGLMRELVKKGLLKRLGRARTHSISCKVLTSSCCPDTVVDGVAIPTYRINPFDDMVREGRIKDGMLAAIYRSPQINLLFGVIELTNTVPVSFIECDWVHWAQSNRGDGDGDSVTLILLS